MRAGTPPAPRASTDTSHLRVRPMQIISADALKAMLPMREAIECLRSGYAEFCESSIDIPNRTIIRNEVDRSFFASMPAYCKARNKYVAKIASFHEQNRSRGKSSIDGVVVVQDGLDGKVEAIIDACSLTALRTAATSGLATDLLAQPDSDSVAIIGTGAQAISQLEAMLAVRPVRDIFVYSRNHAHVQQFISRARSFASQACEFYACDSACDAVRHASIVCTATTSPTPVFGADSIQSGSHVNSVGKHTTTSREIPLDLIADAILLVENRNLAVREAGEYNKHGIEINEALNMDYVNLRARTTVFASVGTAFQDLCIAVKISQLCMA
ncbi:hypothetical protein CJO78_23605 (plasmid) [Ralstonia solanacearum]|nr:hypothetical protein CJO78_23605 [Ralstonia solanacearum]AXW08697.1 hypothetical protein CJO82_23275 [Ralstonia solanacearum]AXW26480.1 hypothetical protein CJO86_23545 [Ralstonia solanacearum]AXW64560.1 hypothetical protein CJO94_23450 [Ralstonia solanacearum]AXW83396.1 hypothetical protein CJO98_23635 [Ralstonia solanacearum]